MKNSINFIFIILFFSCSSTTPTTIREVSNGARKVGNVAQNTNNVVNNINRATEKKYGNNGQKYETNGQNTSRQRNQSSNNMPQKSGLFDIKTGKLLSDMPKVVFVPECISGDCQNGMGKMKIYESGTVYEGEFKDGKPNGYGKIIYPESYISYYEGYVLDSKKNGKGIEYYANGTIFKGNFRNGIPDGLGTLFKDGLTTLNYYYEDIISYSKYFKKYREPANLKSLNFNQLKFHQDTTFTKFKKCNCLDKKTFSINSVGLETVSYDIVNAHTGSFIRKSSELEVVDKSFKVNGYINNTNYNIYIKCYRKEYYKSRNVYEYIDDSYVVYPGQEIMTNYRIQPQPSEVLAWYFKDEFVSLGQYCDKKSMITCKPVAKSK